MAVLGASKRSMDSITINEEANGAVAGLVFPVNPYHLIEVSEPVLTFLVRMKYFLLLAVIISIAGKIYSVLMISFKRVYSKVKSPVYIRCFIWYWLPTLSR